METRPPYLVVVACPAPPDPDQATRHLLVTILAAHEALRAFHASLNLDPDRPIWSLDDLTDDALSYGLAATASAQERTAQQVVQHAYLVSQAIDGASS